MPQLPPPPSRRKTAARLEILDALYHALSDDSRLGEITARDAAFSERLLCSHVQSVLDDAIHKIFRPRTLRTVTWGPTHPASPAIPCIEIGPHRYYPDHAIVRNDFSIAVEVKRYTGQSSIMQQVVGQSVIYSMRYGFVLVFVADTTEQGLLAQKLHPDRLYENDLALQSELWHFHNTLIVCRHVRERLLIS
jgi:hypothetical protein